LKKARVEICKITHLKTTLLMRFIVIVVNCVLIISHQITILCQWRNVQYPEMCQINHVLIFGLKLQAKSSWRLSLSIFYRKNIKLDYTFAQEWVNHFWQLLQNHCFVPAMLNALKDLESYSCFRIFLHGTST
jgi:hypothetical protein